MRLQTFLHNFTPRHAYWGAGILALLVCLYLIVPGFRVSYPTVVEIRSGASLSEVASVLDEQGVIQSGTVLVLLGKLTGSEGRLRAGVFTFSYAESVFSVLYKLTSSRGADVRVTFPEGSSSRDMARILKEAIPNFDADTFLELARPDEGYLFPDTYYFSQYAKPEEVHATLRATFDERIASVTSQLGERSLHDTLTMASILEKEARSYEVRQTVAGILWNRIEEGMPLQVDAVFGYIRGVDTYDPSYADLEIDSPYNTYRNRGLPPTPINNPGLESMRAVLNPIDTPYRYYLTDSEGVMHYSQTFAEHVRNKERYLR